MVETFPSFTIFPRIPEEQKSKAVIETVIGMSEPNVPIWSERKLFYFIKWKNLPYKDCSWVRYDQILFFEGHEKALSDIQEEAQPFIKVNFITDLYKNIHAKIEPENFQPVRILSHNSENQVLVQWGKTSIFDSSWENYDPDNKPTIVSKYFDNLASKPIIQSNFSFDARSMMLPPDFIRTTPLYIQSYLLSIPLEHFVFSKHVLGQKAAFSQLLNILFTHLQNHGPFLIITKQPYVSKWSQSIIKYTGIIPVFLSGNASQINFLLEHCIYFCDQDGKIDKNRLKSPIFITSYNDLIKDSLNDLLSSINWACLFIDSNLVTMSNYLQFQSIKSFFTVFSFDENIDDPFDAHACSALCGFPYDGDSVSFNQKYLNSYPITKPNQPFNVHIPDLYLSHLDSEISIPKPVRRKKKAKKRQESPSNVNEESEKKKYEEKNTQNIEKPPKKRRRAKSRISDSSDEDNQEKKNKTLSVDNESDLDFDETSFVQYKRKRNAKTHIEEIIEKDQVQEVVHSTAVLPNTSYDSVKNDLYIRKMLLHPTNSDLLTIITEANQFGARGSSARHTSGTFHWPILVRYVIISAFLRVPTSKRPKYRKYIHTLSKEIHDHMKELFDENIFQQKILRSLFQGDEEVLLENAFSYDTIYSALLFLSSNQVQLSELRFGPSMAVPIWWTARDDYQLLYSIALIGMENIANISTYHGLSFNSHPQELIPSSDWLLQRAIFISTEIFELIPPDFQYTDQEILQPPLFFDSFGSMFQTNSLSRFEKKKVLQVMFLRGIIDPEKIQKYAHIPNVTIDGISNFVKSILSKTEGKIEAQSDEDWIPNSLIESLRQSMDFIHKVSYVSHYITIKNKQKFNHNMDEEIMNIHLPDWWDDQCDEKLIKHIGKEGFASFIELSNKLIGEQGTKQEILILESERVIEEECGIPIRSQLHSEKFLSIDFLFPINMQISVVNMILKRWRKQGNLLTDEKKVGSLKFGEYQFSIFDYGERPFIQRYSLVCDQRPELECRTWNIHDLFNKMNMVFDENNLNMRFPSDFQCPIQMN